MKPEDIEAIIATLKKYAYAVETKLYWDMSTSKARGEIAETNRLVELLETATVKENEES